MRAVTILIILMSIALVTPLAAQKQVTQDLPAYTPEQRWARASNLLTVFIVAGIAHAKSMNQTAEDYGKFLAKLFAPGWGDPGSGSIGIIRGVQRNYVSWTDAKFEIMESSDVSITARTNRPWTMYFGEDHTWYGVSLDEYEACFKVFNDHLAEYLGLEYKEQIKDDWLYITFSIKK